MKVDIFDRITHTMYLLKIGKLFYTMTFSFVSGQTTINLSLPINLNMYIF